MAGESGAHLHLKIKAYHVDLALDEARRPGLKLEDAGSMVVPRQSYIKRINADSTRPFEEIKAEVRAKAIGYYNLYSAKGHAEAAPGLI